METFWGTKRPHEIYCTTEPSTVNCLLNGSWIQSPVPWLHHHSPKAVQKLPCLTPVTLNLASLPNHYLFPHCMMIKRRWLHKNIFAIFFWVGCNWYEIHFSTVMCLDNFVYWMKGTLILSVNTFFQCRKCHLLNWVLFREPGNMHTYALASHSQICLFTKCPS